MCYVACEIPSDAHIKLTYAISFFAFFTAMQCCCGMCVCVPCPHNNIIISYYSVIGGVCLELVLAQYWSSLEENTLDFYIQFHGLHVSSYVSASKQWLSVLLCLRLILSFVCCVCGCFVTIAWWMGTILHLYFCFVDFSPSTFAFLLK